MDISEDRVVEQRDAYLSSAFVFESSDLKVWFYCVSWDVEKY